MKDDTDTNPLNQTIDWDRYWRDADADVQNAQRTPRHAIEAVCRFIDERLGGLTTFCSVGCGTGAVVFEVADRYPEATVVGYDAAESVLTQNRERLSTEGLDNLEFERAVLPEFEPRTRFDIVFSYFTLTYVADIETALRNLYDAVEPGGYLLFNYQNRYARARWQEMADSPDDFFGEQCVFDRDLFEDRFELLLDGENLLSYDRIHDILDVWPQSVWSVVGKPDIQWSWHYNPLVFVPKPPA